MYACRVRRIKEMKKVVGDFNELKKKQQQRKKKLNEPKTDYENYVNNN